MWLAPQEPGGEPSYETVRGIADATPFAVPAAGALLSVRRPSPGERVAVPDAAGVYLHVVRGEVRLGETGLAPGDAVRITGEQGLDLLADTAAEVLLWELETV